MHGFRHWKWHLDEMYVRINGEKVYLWQQSTMKAKCWKVYVTKTRDKSAARACDAQVPANKVTAEVHLNPCIIPQSLQPGTPSRQQEDLQGTPLDRMG